ncbi:cobalt-precorrin-6A reductase [Hoyosella sp. G463]|uniref:Cobalt-precorrin-6A reductase n=1 Tax=Lolliginicoccus lacisalsi TaxID=2742202 RepID=A0A927JCN8_9ACTN|nr:cobalt-precorrin-6A reductase [Lolliginicoccus lacisalsi]MBD8506889.1 cobalt-precorrin-6A reductase [Lolliginicoccus lacisalsi]
MRVLILGGTGEARQLAAALVGRHAVVSSLAGRVREPLVPVGEVRSGGFGGASGFAAHLREDRIEAVIDATHPFAATMTATAARVTGGLGVPFARLQRPEWEPVPGDKWLDAPDVAGAARIVDGLLRGGGATRALLTVGRQELAAFEDLPRGTVVARTIDAPAVVPASVREVILARGPFTLGEERATLERSGADVLVSKNSGGAATAAKLVAARERGIPVVMVGRPALPGGVTVMTSVAEAVAWADHVG